MGLKQLVNKKIEKHDHLKYVCALTTVAAFRICPATKRFCPI
jgi:hypothetical protein